MTMNERFRARAIEFQTQKALDQEKPDRYFTNALGKDVASAFIKLNRTSPTARQHFLDIVHRDDDVDRWVAFVEHEQKRAESAWKSDDRLKTLPQKLSAWRASLTAGNPCDSIVTEVNNGLQSIAPVLEDDESLIVGLRAFRAMLWRLRSAGGVK